MRPREPGAKKGGQYPGSSDIISHEPRTNKPGTGFRRLDAVNPQPTKTLVIAPPRLVFIDTPFPGRSNITMESADEDKWARRARAARPLGRAFYLQPTVEVARGLLGRLLVHDSPQGLTVGRIVETEAYLADNDPGCHAARGRTERNAPMYEGPGTIYVYFIYGMHCCMNVVTQPEGVPEAVLLRAVEPLAGIELMQRRRGRRRLQELASGPAKLAQAFGVGLEHNRGCILGPPLFITCERWEPELIVSTPRIGLAAGCGEDLPLRMCVANSPWLSRPARVTATVHNKSSKRSIDKR